MKSNISTIIDDIYYVAICEASTFCHPECDYQEFIIAYEGVWELHSNDNSFVLYPGTAYLIKPCVERQLLCKGDAGKYIKICVKNNVLSQWMSDRQQQEVTCVCLSAKQLGHIYRLANNVIKKDVFIEYEDLKTFFENLFNLLLSEYLNDDMRYICDYIWKVSAYDYMFCSVDEICSGYPYSRPVLNQKFKQVVGTTVVQYRAIKKIKCAGKLVLDTDMNIKDISQRMNYLGISYFDKQFKKLFGVSPREYRKKYKNN